MVTNHPTTLVIFGATGDLADKKLIPAIFDLYNQNVLPADFRIVGFSRKDLKDNDYREFIKKSLEKAGKDTSTRNCHTFLQRSFYTKGDITSLDTYKSLAKYLNDLDKESSVCTNKLFYLAVPPTLYETIFSLLSQSGMAIPCANVPGENREVWTRVLVEKPFGSNIEEARKLDLLLGELFNEKQIFRIDHYVAKETMQNILMFRFANAIFESVWNNEYIEKVELKIHEKFGIEDRVVFYDGVGALRDVGQNHLLQMLALIAMEDPKDLTPEAIHKARIEVLKMVTPFKDNDNFAYRGQYEGYTDADGVDNESQTETYFKLKMGVKNKRWKGVPFYLEAGKALKDTKTEIVITFKEIESCVCPSHQKRDHANKITFELKPEDKITICFWAKKPGLGLELEERDLTFKYDSKERLPDAYERVLHDAIKGDQTLFTSTEEVIRQWNIITPICHDWDDMPLVMYKKGDDPKEWGK